MLGPVLKFGLGKRLKIGERECVSYDDSTGNVARDNVFEINHEGSDEWDRGGGGEVSGRGLKPVIDCA